MGKKVHLDFFLRSRSEKVRRHEPCPDCAEGRPLSLESRQGSRDVCRDSASLVLKGKMWKEKSSFWDEWGRCLTCPLGNHPVYETKGKRALHFQELHLWRHRMFTNPWRGGSGSSAHSLCWPSTPQIGSGFTRLINNHGGERNHFTICKSPQFSNSSRSKAITSQAFSPPRKYLFFLFRCEPFQKVNRNYSKRGLLVHSIYVPYVP